MLKVDLIRAARSRSERIAVYDASYPIKYSGRELEMDAQDFAVDVFAGYRDGDDT